MITTKFNQFGQTNCNRALANVKGELVGPTVSLCQHCHQHIPAYNYHANNEYWMSKSCTLHGATNHMIERDYNFISNVVHDDEWQNKNCVMFEVTDRCNIDCPHCYHMPDNKSLDVPIDTIVSRIKQWHRPGMNLMLAGAEPSLHRELIPLIETLKHEFECNYIFMLTNGIRFSDKEFLQQCQQAGLQILNIGLNHPSYINNPTIRKKQIQAINNANELGVTVDYIGYTMSSISELEDILEETTSNNWKVSMFRIRYGSDIGRYPDQERMYVSDIFKLTQAWCQRNGKSFEIVNADNNIYHVMVKIENNFYRLIQWCDETDIDMEELRTGPFSDFVHDGITNFLHQIIRRDVLKNRGLSLPDTPPLRYQLLGSYDTSPLDFVSLAQSNQNRSNP